MPVRPAPAAFPPERGRPSVAASIAGASIVTGLAALLIAAIVHRNTGLYPFVFSDEYTYSASARLLPLDASVIPGYLFLLLYRTTSACGDRFLDCARLLNVALFAAATPFVYAVARRVVSRRIAAAIGLLALAGPFNAYTAYFMPESMYYLGFWVLVWTVVAAGAAPSARRVVAIGAIVGALALVKPHAVFLLPALAFYLLCTASAPRGARSGPAPSAVPAARDVALGAAVPVARHGARGVALLLALLVGTAFAVKLGAGFLFAGRPGVTLFGSFYSGIAGGHGADGVRLDAIARAAVAGLSGHALALALSFALPIAIAGSRLLRRDVAFADDRSRFCLLAAATIGSLVVVTSLFTAFVAGMGPYETTARLHLRYYDFAFPMLLIVGAIGADSPAGERTRRAVFAAACAAALVAAAAVGLDGFALNVVDSPDVLAIGAHRRTRWFAAVLSLAILWAWVGRPRLAAALFVAAVVPWTAWTSGREVDAWFAARRVPDLYDRAGLSTRPVRAAEGGAVRVFGDDASGVYRAMFHIDDRGSSATLLAPHQPVTSSAWPRDARWALVVGDHAIAVPHAVRSGGDGFVLAERTDAAGASAGVAAEAAAR